MFCQECKSSELNFSGTGTQKVEQLISQTFPESKICRLDMDTSKSSLNIASILKSFSNQEFDILIGTQMVAKGLDFPNATLVGIINADLGLYIPDFRATEKVFSAHLPSIWSFREKFQGRRGCNPNIFSKQSGY